jgi:hypothetical protein
MADECLCSALQGQGRSLTATGRAVFPQRTQTKGGPITGHGPALARRCAPVSKRMALPHLSNRVLMPLTSRRRTSFACKRARAWPAPSGAAIPDDKTCDICDIRWNYCAHKSTKYRCVCRSEQLPMTSNTQIKIRYRLILQAVLAQALRNGAYSFAGTPF